MISVLVLGDTDVMGEPLVRMLGERGVEVYETFIKSACRQKKPITENSLRFLDICKDAGYLKADEYALVKTRPENVLLESEHKNWTIIRPYNVQHQDFGSEVGLGTWLTAALLGRLLVLPKDVGMHQTIVTHGDDVARIMVALVGNDKALGEAFHIMSSNHMKRRDVAKIYKDVLEEQTGCSVEIYGSETDDG